MRERYYMIDKNKQYIALNAGMQEWYFTLNKAEAFLFSSKITAEEVRKELGLKGFRIMPLNRK